MISFSSQGEREVLQELADVWAFVDVAGADVGVNVAPPKFGPKTSSPPTDRPSRVGVHRMRFPAKEHHVLVAASRARFACGQHPLLRAFDELEAARPNVLLDHVEDQPVAIIARLDAVDLVVELILELGDFVEVFQASVT